MSYGLIYTVPFATLDNIPCVVEIEKEGYSGNVRELTPASSPFTVDIENDEFLYTPTRFSTAKIGVVGSDYLQSLFSTAYQQYRVMFKKNGVISWCGFIKPELYTQDYSAETFELELECMSAMATLEFIDYKQAGEKRGIISLWELLKKCIASVNSQYRAIYIPHVYAKDLNDYSTGANILESMTISEQNFFDEDDKAMTLKEILEEICKFLNWTCVDWQGELYFVDIDHIGEFYKYDSTSFEKIGTIVPGLYNIQNIGFAGSDQALDILPGYNKVTIRCSNYPVADLLPDLDYEKDTEVFEGPNDIIIDENDSKKNITRKIFLTSDKWDIRQYDTSAKPIAKKDLHQFKGQANALTGAFLAKVCGYSKSVENGKWKDSISDYKYENVLQIRQSVGENFDRVFTGSETMISIKGVAAYYRDGAFVINGQMRPIFRDDFAYDPNGDNPSTKETFSIKCSIRVGDMYYNPGFIRPDEKRWTTTPVVFAVVTEIFSTYNEYAQFRNWKTLDMPYSGAKGYIIPLPDEGLYGDIELIVYCPNYNAAVITPYGWYLKDFSFKYVKKDSITDDNKNNNSDRLYENVINENYIRELDEIEFKISSYNNDGSCYSKIMFGEGYLTDNLYSAIEETTIRPEEQLIRRIIKRYSSPSIKLTQVIKAVPELNPIGRLSDNYMVNKIFINAGGTIDYKMNQFQCIMIEV